MITITCNDYHLYQAHYYYYSRQQADGTYHVYMNANPPAPPNSETPLMPPQPRHPLLVVLLRANAARLRVKTRRAAIRMLMEAGIDPACLCGRSED